MIAIASNPELELVGCYAWSPDKVGRDVGELCGLDPLGVTATDDVDALLALRPDCVVLQPHVAVDRRARADPRSRCQRRHHGGVHQRPAAGPGSQATGRGVRARRLVALRHGDQPGWAELLSIVLAGICDRIDKITVNEAAYTAGYDSPATEKPAGFGRPIDDPNLQAMTAEGTAVFSEAVAMVADALGVELDDVVCEAEYAKTTTDLDLGSWQIAAGCVAGVAAQLAGPGGRPDRGRAERPVEEGARPSSPTGRSRTGYVIEVQGRPTVRTRPLQFLPPPDFQAETLADFMVLGHIMTAMPAINAIPAVVAAQPGIVSCTRSPGCPCHGLVPR